MAYNIFARKMAMAIFQNVCRYVGRVTSYWGLAPSRCFTAWMNVRETEVYDGV